MKAGARLKDEPGKSNPSSQPRQSGQSHPPRKAGGGKSPKPPTSGASRSGKKGSTRSDKPARRAPGALELKALGDNRFAFQPPECAVERDMDLAEVTEMRTEGELEIARDELLYLVADCRGFLEAYIQLAELALEDGDIPLAKGHFGFAYETALEALPPNFRGRLPSKSGYNPHFYAAGRGLARCLIARHEPAKAKEVLNQLLKFDPSEEGTRSLLEQLKERTNPSH